MVKGKFVPLKGKNQVLADAAPIALSDEAVELLNGCAL